MSEQRRHITVQIDESQHADKFEKANSFFEKQLEKALEIIRGHVNSMPKDVAMHRHETIAVLGGRGLGKTSFVLSLIELAKSELKSDVADLPILDPTLIERNEVFLATVCSAILAKLDEFSKEREFVGDQDHLSEVIDRLASAFPVLSPNDKDAWPSSDSDPLDLAERMLRSARSGVNLAKHFAEFVDAAAKAVGVKAFLLPLDDVDTAFERGWVVLEVLRKYLATPRLITILSGDLSLYQMLVLRHNYQQLQSLIDVEDKIASGRGTSSAARGDYQRQAQTLRDQYLKKILPPHRRIHLRSMRDRLVNPRAEDAITLELQWMDSEGKSVDAPLRAPLGRFFRDLYGWPRPLASTAEDVLVQRRNPAARILPANTRSLLRVLKVLCDWHTPTGAHASSVDSTTKKDIDLEHLWQAYDHALYHASIKPDDLRTLAMGQGLDWLAEHVMFQTIDDPDAFLLKGSSAAHHSEETEQAALLVQGAFYRGCRVAQQVSGLVDYGIRGVVLALTIRSAGDPESRKEKAKELSYWVQRGSDLATVDVAGYLRAATWRWKQHRSAGYMRLLKRRSGTNMHAAIKGYTGDKHKEYGLAPWWDALQEEVDVPDKIREQDILPTIGSMWARSKGIASTLLALYYMELQNVYRQTYAFIDIYQGLGNMAELLTRTINDGDADEKTVREFLGLRALPDRIYSMYRAASNNNDESNEDGDDDDAETDESGDNGLISNELVGVFQAWCRAGIALARADRELDGPPLYLPAPVIGHIFESFEKQLGRMVSDKVGEHMWSVGAMLQRWVTAFWQVLLLVEMEYRLGPDFGAIRFDRKGIVKSTDGFEKNLNELEKWLKDSSSELRWQIPRNTLLWMSCPALLAACKQGLRERIKKVIDCAKEQCKSNSEAKHEASWLGELADGVKEAEKLFIKCTWTPYQRTWNADEVHFDIHELWSSLFMAPGKGAAPSKKDYDAFNKKDAAEGQKTNLVLEPPAKKAEQ